ncbi:Histone-lysine N-methyltransferase SETDB1-B [Dissostichus eleginoides]|uniref:Histone-lysine N-methyltransferase SETDB1-B n=1 Tax=Dissostichus eleginoides TaxID=100907 RepID=A0AAD9EWQ9_DISEL|nr:Histone-lysine N-methyltransferase SETDB1-B [Dissostichus eleginoides]
MLMKWQRGKLVDIVTKEDGRLKYKVCFEEKRRSLMSGHHIAFDTTPDLEQLYVGARVVVRFPDHKFRPGVLSELPSRKNRLRFLVFIDDHTPLYLGLPSFHLVPCHEGLVSVVGNVGNPPPWREGGKSGTISPGAVNKPVAACVVALSSAVSDTPVTSEAPIAAETLDLHHAAVDRLYLTPLIDSV